MKYENGKQTDINRQDEYYLSAAVLYQPVKGLELSLAQDGFINTLHTNINDSPNPVRYSSLTALNARYQWGRIKLSGTLVGTFITEEVKAGILPTTGNACRPSCPFPFSHGKKNNYTSAQCIRIRSAYLPSMTFIIYA